MSIRPLQEWKMEFGRRENFRIPFHSSLIRPVLPNSSDPLRSFQSHPAFLSPSPSPSHLRIGTSHIYIRRQSHFSLVPLNRSAPLYFSSSFLFFSFSFFVTTIGRLAKRRVYNGTFTWTHNCPPSSSRPPHFYIRNQCIFRATKATGSTNYGDRRCLFNRYSTELLSVIRARV